jgi:hypothetical protein
MRRSPIFNAVQNCILEQLARVQYATPAQLAFWCGVQTPAISKAVKVLLESGLVDGELTARPSILRLTHAAGGVLQVPMPAGNRYASWSVMAHACHKNEFEISFAKDHPGFRFISRLALLKQGLNPAHGEHAAVDGDKKTWFILLDDYMMGSDRITRSWTRRHTPNIKYWPDPTGRVWNELAHHYLVVCNHTQQAERHKAWIETNGIPAEVLKIAELWKT